MRFTTALQTVSPSLTRVGFLRGSRTGLGSLRPALSEGLPVPWEPGYGSKRSQDGEAPRTCRERQAGCLTRTSGDGAPAAPRPRPGLTLLLPCLLVLLSPARPAEAVHIVLVGDSTVSETDGWGPGLATFLDKDVTLSNRAKNGRSSSSFIQEGLWDEALALDGDYYLIQFGHNDEPGKPGRSTTVEEYRQNMTRYVDDVRAKGAVPVLVTSLVRRKFDDPTHPGRLVSSLDERAEIVRDLARAKKVPLIELHDRSLALCERLGGDGCASLSPRKEDGSVDTTHLNASGARVFGELVADELRRVVPELESKVTVQPPRDGSPIDPGLGHAAVVRREWIVPRCWPTLSCHASTICEVAPGKLVAAWFGGTAERNPDVEIWVSRHDGQRWSDPEMVITGLEADGHREPCWNPVLFKGRPDGPVFLYAKIGPTPRDWWGVACESADDGATWGEVRRLPDGVIGPIKNKPLVLRDGTVIAGCSTEHDGWRVHFERSADGGRTFVAGAPVNVAPGTKGVPRPEGVAKESLIDAIQPSLLALGGDRLLAVGRTKQGRIFEVESGDLGKTWGTLRCGTLPIPSSGTDAVTLADGRHVIVYNHTKSAARTPLDLAISRDGTSWTPVVALETMAGSFAYPAVIQSSTGLIHVTYTWNREAIMHVVIDPVRLP
jgi:predicted neuraminidase/lysophospholipase L1-like esterase